MSLHVYLRSDSPGKWMENYSFLCSHLNYGVSIDSEARACKSLSQITTEYNQKRELLESDMLIKLNEYIPLKITQNILRTSPDKNFVVDTYKNKLHIDEVIARFESVKNSSESSGVHNIECNGIAITGDGKITTQCTVYGGIIGNDDTNGKMGSARIEALRFLDNL